MIGPSLERKIFVKIYIGIPTYFNKQNIICILYISKTNNNITYFLGKGATFILCLGSKKL